MKNPVFEYILVGLLLLFAVWRAELAGREHERERVVRYLRDGPICSETTKRAADVIESGKY